MLIIYLPDYEFELEDQKVFEDIMNLQGIITVLEYKDYSDETLEHLNDCVHLLSATGDDYYPIVFVGNANGAELAIKLAMQHNAGSILINPKGDIPTEYKQGLQIKPDIYFSKECDEMKELESLEPRLMVGGVGNNIDYMNDYIMNYEIGYIFG